MHNYYFVAQRQFANRKVVTKMFMPNSKNDETRAVLAKAHLAMVRAGLRLSHRKSVPEEESMRQRYDAMVGQKQSVIKFPKKTNPETIHATRNADASRQNSFTDENNLLQILNKSVQAQRHND